MLYYIYIHIHTCGEVLGDIELQFILIESNYFLIYSTVFSKETKLCQASY